eukprot:TRINITY_DN2867_c0_g1_i2.p1 TRINITY_DN2867_c0_g1~~TRINITY_DN2867_c0_g1_i2.p1  ORF type:complete len:418 (-),score=85.35 TRINITY_DN2867_c0_g1_i2:887-2098(-)
MSLFQNVLVAPDDAILGLNKLFREDTSPSKLNLGVGAYRTADGKPLVLDVVHQVEDAFTKDRTYNKEYLPIDGLPEFMPAAAKLILGKDSVALKENRVASIQSLSGTGGLSVLASFIRLHLGSDRTIYLSDPTWGNHTHIFTSCGLNVAKYRYYDAEKLSLGFEAYKEDLNAAPAGSIIVLHACAHNPTGVDPTHEQWKELADIVEARGLIPLFDSAYQGFASGDLDTDAFGIRAFAERGLELFVCQSFAKNLGLYGERIGCIHVVCADTERKEAVLSQLKRIARGAYSSPPRHGAQIVAAVLNDEATFNQWKKELLGMANRIHEMRDALKAAFIANETPGNWDHITNQIGMFTYTGLTAPQVLQLREKYHVYMLSSGRISMAGLNAESCVYLANAVKDVLTA